MRLILGSLSIACLVVGCGGGMTMVDIPVPANGYALQAPSDQTSFCCDPAQPFPQKVGTVTVENTQDDFLGLGEAFLFTFRDSPGGIVTAVPSGGAVAPGESVEVDIFVTTCDFTTASINVYAGNAPNDLLDPRRRRSNAIVVTNACPPGTELLRIVKDGVEELFPFPEAAFAEADGTTPATDTLVAVAHDGGFDVVDAADGSQVAPGPFPADLIGAFPLVYRDGSEAVVSFAIIGYGGPNLFRARRLPGGFSTQLLNGRNGQNYTDGIPYDLDPEAAGGLIVDHTFGEVLFLGWRPDPFNAFGFVGAALGPDELPNASGRVISAFSKSATADAFVVTDGQPGELWKWTRGAAEAVRIGNVGDDPRRVRCFGDLVVVTNFGSNTLTVARIDAGGACTIVGTQPVGEGPVGLDGIALSSGGLAVASTSSADDTWTRTVLDAQGNTVSNETRPAPAGCVGPFHVRWLSPGRIAISCTTSGEAVIVALEN